MKRLQKAWVFVSHSTRDIDEVRLVRNEVEAQGGEPLLFFLKCITEAGELDELLKREIRARRYFLLCDSQAARVSNWVKGEIAEVRRLRRKRVGMLDLKSPWSDQQKAITRLLRMATVFPCYAPSDRDIVEPLLRSLSTQEFGLFDPHGEQGRFQTQEDLQAAIRASGFFLDFLSPDSVYSDWCRAEREYFRDRAPSDSIRIPVLLARELRHEIPRELLGARPLDYSQRNDEALAEDLEQIMLGE